MFTIIDTAVRAGTVEIKKMNAGKTGINFSILTVKALHIMEWAVVFLRNSTMPLNLLLAFQLAFGDYSTEKLP